MRSLWSNPLAVPSLLLAAALGFRLFLALHLPNDAPDDGRLYARIATNILDHHSYSIETAEPFAPTYLRVPGYPLFLAGVYKVFGHGNNRAVRIVQALLDTLTCLLTGLLALAWLPASWSQEKRRRVMLIAFALAAACPFTAIYVATILTETWAIFLAVLCLLTASWALKSEEKKAALRWWLASGVAGGALVLFRPDGALFVAAAGLTMVLTAIGNALARRSGEIGLFQQTVKTLLPAVLYGVVLSAGFVACLVPWTIRNARVFKVFQPIAPADATMPDEFSPDGYIRWLRSWTRDWRYIDAVEWSVDDRHIVINQFPDYAFDSPDERARVAALLEQYNRVTPAAPVKVEVPKAQFDDKEADDSDDEQDELIQDSKADVKMTPELDAQFAALARERISRQPLRYYFGLPARRAASLWFDTHSQYYPFEGELFPLSRLDRERHQHYWLSLFMLVLWALTILGLSGVWVLARSQQAGRWILMLGLTVLPRLMFLSSLENPEPRYVVELFPFVVAAASIALSALADRFSSVPR